MGNFCKKKQNGDFLEKLVSRGDLNLNSETIFSSYFLSVRELFLKNYKENRNNQTNISICLEKKDFESAVTVKKQINFKKQKFIYWKDYLLKYLNKKFQQGYLWAGQLCE